GRGDPGAGAPGPRDGTRPSIPPIASVSVRYRGNGSACRRQAGGGRALGGRQASIARRTPLFPLASSAAGGERAATRERWQYEAWHGSEPPRIPRTSPVSHSARPVVHGSLHRSQTFPATSYSP